MIEIRPYAALSGDERDWLKARNHIPFAASLHAATRNWGALRAWNDDEIAPQKGFPPHPHASMEIVTYVREGVITHQDSLGNVGQTRAGDVQVMSTGTEIRHCEYNLENTAARLFQIWIAPDRGGGAPAWGTKHFPREDRAGRLVTLASGYAEDTEALPIRARARVLGATVPKGVSVNYKFAEHRFGYLVAARGQIELNGVLVEERDGAAIRDVSHISLKALRAFCEFFKSDDELFAVPIKGALSMKTFNLSMVVGAILATAAATAATPSPTLDSVKAGSYAVDGYHTQVGFSLSHFGFTNYSGLFSGATGNLRLDPGNLAATKLDVNIPVQSIQTTVPVLTDELKGDKWFDVAKFPQATFTSTKVSVAGNGDLTIAGNLTLHGVTKPVVLHAHLVGAGVNPIDKAYTVGFQASGTIKRSDFGVNLYAPALGDDVELSIAGAFELHG